MSWFNSIYSKNFVAVVWVCGRSFRQVPWDLSHGQIFVCLAYEEHKQDLCAGLGSLPLPASKGVRLVGQRSHSGGTVHVNSVFSPNNQPERYFSVPFAREHVSLASVGKSTSRIHRCLPHAGCHRRSVPPIIWHCLRGYAKIYEQDR